MIELLTISAVAIFVYMTLLFLLALTLKDNSIVDIGWGPGFILVSIVTIIYGHPFPGMRGIAYFLVLLWGLRLAVYVFFRNRGRGEDFRYAAWRREWGRNFVLRSYLQIFMLQGLIMLIVAYPLVLITVAPFTPVGLIEMAGGMIWVIGFFFEAVGDYQMSRFKKNPANRGKIMTTGLWRCTRHPNYFGETAMWWGVFLLALPLPYGWTAIISPLAISFLLLKVSGIPMLEKKYAGNPEFEAYKAGTSAFFPWFSARR